MTANEFISLNDCVFKKPYQNGKMGCAFLLGLTSVGTFRVCGPWDSVGKPEGTWPPKKFTKDKKNNKQLRKPLSLGDLLPLQCFFSATSKVGLLIQVCCSHSLFLTQKKKETSTDRAAKFSLGGAAGVTTMCLETHALPGGGVTSASKHSKKKKKKMHRFHMISFIAQIATELHKAVLLSEKGSCGDNSWSRARGNLGLSKESLQEFPSS